MGSIHPFFFRSYPRYIRREIHRLHKQRAERVIQNSEVAKPKFVTLLNGQRIKYEGP